LVVKILVCFHEVLSPIFDGCMFVGGGGGCYGWNCIKNVNTRLTYITNLACDDLIMKIVQSLYILHMNVICWKHIWHMNKIFNKWSVNLWMNECHTNFASSYKFMSNVFSTYDISAWNIWITNGHILHDFHY